MRRSGTFVRQNRGLAAARNRGLAESSGDLVIFLDADDRLLPDGIEAGVRALASNPGCALAYGRCVMIGPDGTEWPTPQQRRVLSGHHAVLLRTNPIWTPAMAIFRRHALLEAGGFAEGFDGSADYDLYLRIARTYPVHDHGAPVAAYRRHEASSSGSAQSHAARHAGGDEPASAGRRRGRAAGGLARRLRRVA